MLTLLIRHDSSARKGGGIDLLAKQPRRMNCLVVNITFHLYYVPTYNLIMKNVYLFQLF